MDSISCAALSVINSLNPYAGLIGSLAALVGLLFLRGQLKVMAMQNELLSDEAKERKARAFVTLDSALQPLTAFLSPYAEMLSAGNIKRHDGKPEWFLGGSILEKFDPSAMPAWDDAAVLDACAIAAPEHVGQVRSLLNHFNDYRDACARYVEAGSPDQSPPNIGEENFPSDPIRRKFSDALNGMVTNLSAILKLLPDYRKAE